MALAATGARFVIDEEPAFAFVKRHRARRVPTQGARLSILRRCHRNCASRCSTLDMMMACHDEVGHYVERDLTTHLVVSSLEFLHRLFTEALIRLTLPHRVARE